MMGRRLRQLLPHVFIFGVALGVYVYTLCPTVYWDDAGELIAACYTLGIPHPPGHPLYAILGHLFTLIPLGSPAYRVNLMSAFFGALTCVVLYQIVRELVLREERMKQFATFAGLTTGLIAAFSGILWDQSLVAETTTLHSFFMMVVTLIAFRIYFDGPTDPRLTRRLLAFSFLYGLSFTNHVAGLFFAPSLAFILISGTRLNLFKPARLSVMILLFALGLSVYVYLPIRSSANPAVDWGNPENLTNFLWVVTARQYSSKLLRVPTFMGVVRGVYKLGGAFISNLGPLGCAFALVGGLSLWKRKKPIVIYGSVVILILFLTTLNSAFISVYLLPAILMLLIWGGYGLAFFCRKAADAASTYSGGWNGILAHSAHAAGILVAASLFFVHFPELNKRDYVYAKEYGMDLLSSLPENAVLITGSADPLFIGWYLQYCEGFRTDVKIVTRNGLIRPGYLNQLRREHPDLEIPAQFQYTSDVGISPAHLNERDDGLPWYANSYFKLFYELNAPRFPIFWEGIEANQLLMEKFVPYHLVFRILPPDQSSSPDAPNIPRVEEITERIHNDPASGLVYGNHFFNDAVLYQWHGNIDAAEFYYESALRLNPKDTRSLNNVGALLIARGRPSEAREKFEVAFQVDPDNPTSNHNLGQVLLEGGKAQEAEPYFRRAIASDSGNFEDYYNLGLCYAASGNNKQAAEMFRQALRIKPESPQALSSLGVAYLRLQETENAEEFLKSAVRLEPHNAENWYNLACLHVLEGDTSDSVEDLRKALSINYSVAYDLASKDSRMSPLLDSILNKP